MPNGELRGGAWVVLDPSINADGMMEMYADETSRAGVLEPEGIVEIKLRKERLLGLMDRLDPTYHDLKVKSTSPGATAEDKTALAQREKILWPLYSQIALQFADLHDRATRMKAKGTIREKLVWTEARRYFYWRLRRRLEESGIAKRLFAADSSLSTAEQQELVASFVAADMSVDASNDQAVTLALEKNPASVAAKIKEMRSKKIARTIGEMAGEDHEAFVQALTASLGKDLSPADIETLNRLIGPK